MGYPILQVSVGKFSKAHQGLCLAVLSTRLLSIHFVESTSSFTKLTDICTHKLERNSFNMINGYFGNEYAKNEQICVQSVDGVLYMIDDKFILFKIQLPDYLVPGPLLYSQNTGCIIIANSNLEIECYNYQSMKAFTNNDIEQQKENQAKDDKKSKMEPLWVTNIGE